jgi:hypothetical protein
VSAVPTTAVVCRFPLSMDFPDHGEPDEQVFDYGVGRVRDAGVAVRGG